MFLLLEPSTFFGFFEFEVAPFLALDGSWPWVCSLGGSSSELSSSSELLLDLVSFSVLLEELAGLLLPCEPAITTEPTLLVSEV